MDNARIHSILRHNKTEKTAHSTNSTTVRVEIAIGEKRDEDEEGVDDGERTEEKSRTEGQRKRTCLQLVVAQVEHFDRVVRLEQQRDLRAVRRQHLVVREVQLAHVLVRAQRGHCAQQTVAVYRVSSDIGTRPTCTRLAPTRPDQTRPGHRTRSYL